MASPVTQHSRNQGMRYLQWVFQKMDRQFRLKGRILTRNLPHLEWLLWHWGCWVKHVFLLRYSWFYGCYRMSHVLLKQLCDCFFDLWGVAWCQADVIAHSQGNSPIFIIGFASLNWDEWITAAILLGISSKFNKFALLRIMWITKKLYSLFLHKCISDIRLCISLCLYVLSLAIFVSRMTSFFLWEIK